MKEVGPTLHLKENITKPQSVDISFRNITYAVPAREGDPFSNNNNNNKYLLNNVSGIVKAGQVTAVMGASGAGKTTLLNLLACRLPDPPTSGHITANGLPYNIDLFGSWANYVMQKDVLIQTLTVRETLTFAADLKLRLEPEEKKERVDRLAKQFGLRKCLDILVGGFLLKGISGGQKRRTFIAFEVMSDSRVLVLDEPTSGLDSLTAFLLVKFLRQMVHNENKTVFLTIHQPNSDIFQLFDRLILILDGKFIYQGPAEQAENYFADHLGLACPEYSNPADYFMFVMSTANQEQEKAFFQAYQTIIAPKIQKELAEETTGGVLTKKESISFWLQLRVLVGRDFLNFMRNPLMIWLRILETIATALFIGGIFYRFSGEYMDELNWKALTGFFFFMAIAVSMTNMAAVSFTFPSDRDVFLKEEGAKLYSTAAYFVSRNIIQLPYAIIFPFFQTLMIYWLVNLSSTATQFFIFYLISYLLTLNGESLGLMVGSMATDAKSVTTISMMLFLPLFLFAGFFKNMDSLPHWVGWIQYITPFKYGFAAYTQNEVLFASESRIGDFNFDLTLWGHIGLLAILSLAFRFVSFLFLWALRTRLQ